MFRKRIHEQIDEYIAFSTGKPWIRNGERAMLHRFADDMRLKDVSEITRNDVNAFVTGELSQFYTQRTLIALRAFLRYARWAGYPCIHYINLTKHNLMRSGPKVDPKNIQKTIELKGRGLTYRQIVAELQKTSKKRIHLTSVARWAKLSTF